MSSAELAVNQATSALSELCPHVSEGLTMLAGWPNNGTRSLAMNLALEFADYSDRPVWYIDTSPTRGWRAERSVPVGYRVRHAAIGECPSDLPSENDRNQVLQKQDKETAVYLLARQFFNWIDAACYTKSYLAESRSMSSPMPGLIVLDECEIDFVNCYSKTDDLKPYITGMLQQFCNEFGIAVVMLTSLPTGSFSPARYSKKYYRQPAESDFEGDWMNYVSTVLAAYSPELPLNSVASDGEHVLNGIEAQSILELFVAKSPRVEGWTEKFKFNYDSRAKTYQKGY